MRYFFAIAWALVLSAAARGGEVRAVWEQSGKGLYPGDWPRTVKWLRDKGFTDLFLSVGGAEFAHFRSATLPPSHTLKTQGDQLAQCLAAARGTGLRVHAWLLCFNATRASAAQKAAFARKKWFLKNPDGAGDLTYLDPSNPDVRWHLLKVTEEIAKTYAVDGVHLDFVRWHERPASAEATPAVTARFRAERKVAGRRAFLDWRTAKVSSFVAAAGARVKAARPSAVFSVAVLGKYPSCVDAAGQDWKAWLDAGTVDWIVPMNYTDDAAKYASFLAVQTARPDHARRIVSGIGVTANGLSLSARQTAAQIASARAVGLTGFALFDLDDALTRILCYNGLDFNKRQEGNRH